MSGTYPEQVYLTSSGSADGGYITYQAYPGQTPVMTNYNQYAAFNFASGVSYVIIDGFTIVGNAASVAASQARSLATNYSTYVTNGDCISAKGNHIVIRNNNLSECPGAGLGVAGDYFYVYGNTIYDNAYWSSSDKSGISITGVDSDTSTAAKIWVYDNIVYGNQNFICNVPETNPCKITDGEGIIVDSDISNNFHGRTEIFNNLVYGNGGPGIEAYQSQHVDIVNNTTYMNNVSALEPPPYQAHAQNAEVTVGNSLDISVFNDTLYSQPGAPSLYIFGTPPSQLLWDYNIQFNSSGSLTGVGGNNIVADPLFVSPSLFNFGLSAGSPAIGAGTPAEAPSVDLLGVSRSASIDIGAYEYDSIMEEAKRKSPTKSTTK